MKKIKYIVSIFFLFLFIPKAYALNPSIEYKAHVEEYGWMNTVKDGEMAGTTGESRRLEAIEIKLNGIEGSIEYSSHVEEYGWQDWKKDGQLAGTTGESKRLEAIKIRLTGEAKEKYNIYYRTHVSFIGWQAWVKNGEISGTTGESRRLEAIEIKLVEKSNKTEITYKTYVGDSGWQNYVENSEISGTTGESKPIQVINIDLNKIGDISGDIMYETYNSSKGWLGYKTSNQNSGEIGIDIEAVRIKLTGELEKQYDIYYRVHVSYLGWLDYTKNGNIAGTIGHFKRVEAIEISLVDKFDNSISVGNNAYKESKNTIEYSSHVERVGWQNYVKDSNTSGTTGESKRLEAFKIKMDSDLDYKLSYQSYIEKKGWQNYVSDNQVSGTEGKGKWIEAIRIKLEGDLAAYYDIYYRAHVSNIGWLDWAKNNEIAGSIGSDTKIEAIEIKLVRKGTAGPSNTKNHYVTGRWDGNSYIDYFGNRVVGFRYIDGIKYYFNEEGTLIGRNVRKAIDVSYWQGRIDWDTIKYYDDVDEAILRVGWGMSYDDPAGIDSTFDYNIREVQRLGIRYSIYIYGYAEVDRAARREANFVSDMMKKYNIPKDTFVWYDAEINTISLSTYDNVIPIFVNQMHANGYNNVGVYGSLNNFISSYGNLNSATIRSYPLWVAQYYKKIQYPGSYLGWQLQSDGIVDGVNGNVDVSMFYN